MRIRTVYFKVPQLEAAVAFWTALLGVEPVKVFPAWQEFLLGDLRLGLLRLAADGTPRGRCVPVFEVADDEIDAAIERAKQLGAVAVLEGKDHPDWPRTAAVLVDPFGNEFEVTNLHG